jgi:hypothetical protein
MKAPRQQCLRRPPAAVTKLAPEASEPALAEKPKSKNATPKEQEWKPKQRQKMKLKAGQALSHGTKPSLLCDEIEAKICGFLRDGLSIIDAATMGGVNSATVSDWRARGSQEPESRYGLFFERTEMARTEWKYRSVVKVSENADPKHCWKLLCSRYPQEFRNYFSTELSGPNGQPVPLEVSGSGLTVNIVMQSDPNSAQNEFKLRELVSEPHSNGA